MYVSVDLLSIPPGFAEGMRFDDHTCSTLSMSVPTTTDDNQTVNISRLLLEGRALELVEQSRDIDVKSEVICVYQYNVMH